MAWGIKTKSTGSLAIFPPPGHARIVSLADSFLPPVLCLPVERIDNSRVKSLEFEAKTSYTMHGFAGYFETVLYKDVTLSKYKLYNFREVLERFSFECR